MLSFALFYVSRQTSRVSSNARCPAIRRSSRPGAGSEQNNKKSREREGEYNDRISYLTYASLYLWGVQYDELVFLVGSFCYSHELAFV